MVELLLNVLAREDVRDVNATTPITFYHINARLSEGSADIGRIRPTKLCLLLCYCLQAIICRFRFNVNTFYYIPAPPVRSALYRDWIVMLLCRPFFRRLILHWQAAGLGDWLATEAAPWERAISRLLFRRPNLSIVLAESNQHDAAILESKHTCVIPNAIPDPCPDFDLSLRPSREARISAREHVQKNKALETLDATGANGRIFEVLFIGLCYSEKGLFDAIEAVALANQKLGDSLRIRLTVAGEFYIHSERDRFEARIKRPDLRQGGEPLVRYVGFISGKEKDILFRNADCLCFPTYYKAESFGLVLAEAMAYGLSIVTTNWRMIPEIMPRDYPGIVEPRNPAQLAGALISATAERSAYLREHFLRNFTSERFAESIKAAFLCLDQT